MAGALLAAALAALGLTDFAGALLAAALAGALGLAAFVAALVGALLATALAGAFGLLGAFAVLGFVAGFSEADLVGIEAPFGSGGSDRREADVGRGGTLIVAHVCTSVGARARHVGTGGWTFGTVVRELHARCTRFDVSGTLAGAEPV